LGHNLARNQGLRLFKRDVALNGPIANLWCVNLLRLLNERVPFYDHFEQALNLGLRLVHLLVADEKFNGLIYVEVLAFRGQRVLKLGLHLPFFLEAQAQHEGLERVEAELVKLAHALVLDSIFASNLPLELIDVILALDLAENLYGSLLDDLTFFHLVATVFKLVCLGRCGCHQLTPTNRALLLGEMDIVEERT